MIYYEIENKTKEACTLALGYFDGVHIGHEKVINAALKCAREKKIECAVFTFTDKKRLCKKKSERGEVYIRERSVEKIKNMGVDFLIMPDFEDFCALSPSEFVSILCKNFGVKAFFCGEDYRFGKNAAGNVETLKKEAEKYGAEVCAVVKVQLDGEEVSSTSVTQAIKDGNMPLVKKYLLRNYSIKGTVVGGKHIGKKRLYPTINLPFEKQSVVPKNGVYASRVRVEGECFLAVTNVGHSPTVDGGTENVVCESYIIDKALDLYDKEVEVEFIKFIRDEIKFDSIEALKNQIDADIMAAKKIGCEEDA